MARCTTCNATILFGGVGEGEQRYCSDGCRHRGVLIDLSHDLPEGFVRERVWRTHQSVCPSCNGHGPVDVHRSHRIWSAIVRSSWQTSSHVCCRRCGVRRQLGDLLVSSVVGWWGLPYGVLVTPVQIARNVKAIVSPPESTEPSPALERAVRLELGLQQAEQIAHPPATPSVQTAVS